MPRVWKYFLKNLVWPVGIPAYVLAVFFVAEYVDKDISSGVGVVVVILFVGLPVLGYLVREMWQDAKQKVEREDQEMMRTLRSNDLSDLYEN